MLTGLSWFGLCRIPRFSSDSIISYVQSRMELSTPTVAKIDRQRLIEIELILDEWNPHGKNGWIGEISESNWKMFSM
jgi:hypothetical protein